VIESHAEHIKTKKRSRIEKEGIHSICEPNQELPVIESLAERSKTKKRFGVEKEVMHSISKPNQELPVIESLAERIKTKKRSGIEKEASVTKKHVVVIGAGFSGLAAARELEHLGFQVTIIEARNRIGGRAWSSDIGGSIVDLGASYIHGIDGNPVAKLAKKFKKHLVEFDGDQLFDFDGKWVSEEADNAAELTFNTALEEVCKTRSSKVSLGTIFYEEVARYPLSDEAKRLLDWHVSHLEYSLNENIDKVSCSDFDQDDVYRFSGNHVMVNEGMGSIVACLSSGLNIQFEQPVTEIEYNGDSVTVTTKNGKTFGADFCMVTLPIGVLKSKQIKFIPGLPVEKKTSIDALGSGILNKIALKFPYIFWETNNSFVGYASKTKGEYPLFFDGSRISNGSPVLVGLVSGGFATRVSRISDTEVVGEVLQVLRLMFGNAIPDPIDYHITKWHQDEYSLGSFSYVSSRGTADDYDTMSYPVSHKNATSLNDFRLFFAGEATTRFHPATVHGAFLSGIREAYRIHKIVFGSKQMIVPNSRLLVTEYPDKVVDEYSHAQITEFIIQNYKFN